MIKNILKTKSYTTSESKIELYTTTGHISNEELLNYLIDLEENKEKTLSCKTLYYNIESEEDIKDCENLIIKFKPSKYWKENKITQYRDYTKTRERDLNCFVRTCEAARDSFKTVLLKLKKENINCNTFNIYKIIIT